MSHSAASTSRSQNHVGSVYRAAKRTFDVVVSVLLLVVVAPVMGAIALLIRLRMGSPVLFKQQRPGRAGQSFTMIKFRTMTDARDDGGELLPPSQRITGLGLKLRNSSLDELPELINVVRGDMSLVGPRPLRMEYLALYSERQLKRHDVRPGITGLAQVNGRNELSWPERLEMDVAYVERASFTLDLKLLARTIGVVMKGRGVHVDGSKTVEPFQGERAHETEAAVDEIQISRSQA